MTKAEELLELRNKRGEVADQARALLDRGEKRGFTDSEQTFANRLKQDLIDIDGQIKILEGEIQQQRDALDAEFKNGSEARERDSATRYAVTEKRTAKLVTADAPLETRSYSELCRRCDVDPNDLNGWDCDEEFYSALLSGRHDPRLYREKRAAGMNTNVFQEGGAVVPEKIAGRILDLSLEQEVVRPRAKVYPITAGEGRTLHVPVWNTYDRSSGNISGTIQMAMVGEEAEIATSKGLMHHVAYDLKKGAVMVPISNEILSDAPRFLGDLEAAIATAVAFGRDDMFLNATGGSKPTGALQGTNKVTITKETGQLAATIMPENIVKMMSRMLPSSLVSGSATWVAHPSTFPALSLLAFAIGTAGTLTRMLEGDAQRGFRLQGIPLVFSEKAAVLGTTGDIALIDFSRYGIAERPGMNIALSEHFGFDTDQTYIRVIVRFDGKPLDGVATTPKNGSTFSSTVTLETRS